LTAQHVLSDIIAHQQELLNCNYTFWFYSGLSLLAAVMAVSHDSGQQRHVEHSITNRIINYPTQLHLVGPFYTIYLYDLLCCSTVMTLSTVGGMK
jgi:hypothetical protein